MIFLAGILIFTMAFQGQVQSGHGPATGLSVTPDKVAVLKQKAAEGDPQAQVDLGIAFASGDGVAADEVQAVKWFRKAAEQRYAAGEYALGEMYLTGRGVTLDQNQAVKWIRLSAEHGDPRGQFNLAAMYKEGIGVTRDDAKAVEWMRKAADQGFAAGQFGLGVMYARGSGVRQDLKEAIKWYTKAGEQGDGNAWNNLAFLLATTADTNVKNPKEAIIVALRAVEINPKEAAYLDTLATAYYEAGNFSEAVQAQREAIALAPEKSSYKQSLEKYLDAAAAKH